MSNPLKATDCFEALRAWERSGPEKRRADLEADTLERCLREGAGRGFFASCVRAVAEPSLFEELGRLAGPAKGSQTKVAQQVDELLAVTRAALDLRRAREASTDPDAAERAVARAARAWLGDRAESLPGSAPELTWVTGESMLQVLQRCLAPYRQLTSGLAGLAEVLAALIDPQEVPPQGPKVRVSVATDLGGHGEVQTLVLSRRNGGCGELYRDPLAMPLLGVDDEFEMACAAAAKAVPIPSGVDVAWSITWPAGSPLVATGASIGAGMALGLLHLLERTAPLQQNSYAITGAIDPQSRRLLPLGSRGGYAAKLAAARARGLTLIVPEDDLGLLEQFSDGNDPDRAVGAANLVVASEIASGLASDVVTYLKHLAARMAVKPVWLGNVAFEFERVSQRVRVRTNPATNTPAFPALGAIEDTTIEGAEDTASEETDKVPGSTLVVPFDTIRESISRTIVWGRTGLGKTWLLRSEALRIANEGIRAIQEGRLHEVVLPMHVRLEDVGNQVSSPGVSAPSFREAILGLLSVNFDLSSIRDEERFVAWVESRLDGGMCVLLLDGLDEMRADRRPRFSIALEAFALTSACRFILTSRPGPEPPAVADQQVELVEFGRTHLEQFIRGWYLREPERGRQVLARLRSQPRLLDMARNPLLLTFLCLLGAEEALPSRRSILYGRLLRGLLEGRWRSENLRELDPGRVDAKLDLLEELAWHFATARGRWRHAMDETEVFRTVADLSSRGGPVQAADLPALIRELVERDGVLTRSAASAPGDNNTYFFLHPSFHEYLVGLHLARVRNWSNPSERMDWLAPHLWLDEDWRESIALHVGTLPMPHRFLSRLLDEPNDAFHGFLLLAALCLSEAEPGAGTQELEAEALHRLAALLRSAADADRQRAGQALAQLGEAGRGALLAALDDEESEVREASVRALGLVGEPQAITALIRALDDSDWDVREAAGESLARLADPSALPNLLAILQEETHKGRRVALEALSATIQPWNPSDSILASISKDVVPVLLDLLGSEDSALFERSCGLLARTAGDQVFERLSSTLARRNHEVPHPAADALWQIDPRRARAFFLQALHDPSEATRAAAARALGNYGVKEALPQIIPMLIDPVPEVATGAAEALGSFRDPSSGPALVEALGHWARQQPDVTHSWDTPARAILHALIRIDETSYLPALARMLPDPATRPWAAIALEAMPDQDLVPQLQVERENSDVERSRVAIRLLGAIAGAETRPGQRVSSNVSWHVSPIGSFVPAVSLTYTQQEEQPTTQAVVAGPAMWSLLDALGDERREIRLAAARRLCVGLGGPILVTGLLNTIRSPNERARAAATWALRRCSLEGALEILRRARRDPNPSVHREAKEALLRGAARRSRPAKWGQQASENQQDATVAQVIDSVKAGRWREVTEHLERIFTSPSGQSADGSLASGTIDGSVLGSKASTELVTVVETIVEHWPEGTRPAAQLYGTLHRVVRSQRPRLTHGQLEELRRELSPPTAHVLVEGLTSVERASFSELTEGLFRRALHRYPHFNAVRRRLGELLHAWPGRATEALSILEECVERDPKDLGARQQLGEALRWAGNPQEALKVHRETLRRSRRARNGWRAFVLRRAAQCCFELRHFGWARRHLDRAADLEPSSEWLHYWYASIALETGDLVGAVQHCRSGLRLQPNEPSLNLLFGEVRLREGKPKLAKNRYERGVALSRNWGELRYRANRLRVLVDQGAVPTSFGMIQHAIENKANLLARVWDPQERRLEDPWWGDARLVAEMVDYLTSVIQVASAPPPNVAGRREADLESQFQPRRVRMLAFESTGESDRSGRYSRGLFDDLEASGLLYRRQPIDRNGSKAVSRSGSKSWEDVRDQVRAGVIVGDAGSGKSWLLRNETIRLARLAMTILEGPDPSSRRVRIPVLLALSNLRVETEPTPDAFQAATIQSLAVQYGMSERLVSWFSHHLEDRCTLLLDDFNGLPDAPSSVRLAMSQALTRYSQKTQEPILLSARKVTFEWYSDLRKPDWVGFELVDFDKATIEAAVRNHLRGRERTAGELLTALRTDPGLASLAGLPLMLSLLCDLAEEMGPQARHASLYERVVRCFLAGSWHGGSQASFEESEPKLRVLSDLALRAATATEGSRGTISIGDLQSILGAQASASPADPTTGVSAVLRELAERDGILTLAMPMRPAGPPSQPVFRFAHQRIQDYFVARRLVDDDDWRAIAAAHAWFELDWRQSIVLLASFLPDPRPVVSLLLAQPDDSFHEMLLMAGECLGEPQAWRTCPDLVAEVVGRLALLLRSSSARDQQRAAIVLTGLGPLGIDTLVDALGDSDISVREAALAALGRAPAEQAVPRIEARLSDPSAELRMWALAGLARLATERPWLHALIERHLSDPDELVRHIAARELVRLSTRHAKAALQGDLGEDDPQVRRLAAASLKASEDLESWKVLERALSDPDVGVRFAGLRAIGTNGGEGLARALLAAIRGDDEPLALAAFVLLDAHITADEESLQDLLDAFSEIVDSDTAAMFAESLGPWGIAVARKSFLGEIVEDAEWVERAVTRRFGACDVPALQAALESEIPGVRAYALSVLWQTGDSTSAELAAPLLDDAEPSVRIAAALGLGRIGDAQAVPRIVRSLNDSDSRVRAAAVMALGRVGDPSATRHLLALTQGEYDEIASLALEALGRIGDPSVIPGLLGLMSGGNEELVDDVLGALEEIADPTCVHALWEAQGELPDGSKAEAVRLIGDLGFARALEVASGMIERWLEAVDTVDKSRLYEALMTGAPSIAQHSIDWVAWRRRLVALSG